jgi:hypothetical protein
MSTRGALLALALVALAAAPGAAQDPGKITAPGHDPTRGAGAPGGSIGSVVGGHGARPDATDVSLDAVAAAPARFDGRTLARRVSLGATKPYGDGVAIAARDEATGKRLGAEPSATAFALVMTKEFADELGATRDAAAVVTFTVTSLPIPGQTTWIGAVSHVDQLDENGNVTRSVDAN